MRSIRFSLALTAALGLAACDPATEPGTQPTDFGTLALSLSGVEVLPPGFVYEGWLIVDGAPVSAGRFAGDAADLTFDFDLSEGDDAATAYVLTIEPEPDADPAPSNLHLLAGDLSDGAANLTVDHPAALGTDWSASAGIYILETPTSGAVADDYDQGIWWIDPRSGMPQAGLDLTGLPAGWTYEGWVVVDGEPISTGTFSAGTDAEMPVEGADDDGAGATAGPDGAPPFPGQDFIDPATVLTGGAAVISVEPVPDTSPAPFVLKPLIDGDIEDLGAAMPQTMDDMAPLPTGAVVLQ